MARTPVSAGTNWPRAAEQLARRFNRRERLATVLRRIGIALFGAAAAALLWRALAAPPAGLDARLGVGVFLLVGAGIGGLWAALGRRSQRPVAAGDAAWALDRLAGGGGRGLAAAAARGPAASEAAFAPPRLAPPPHVRLLPPGGLVPLVGAALVAALAFLAPTPPAASPPGLDGASADRAPGGAAAAEAPGADAEARAQALDREAAAARRAREALNLPLDGPLDPTEVAQRLSDLEARRKAAAAVGPDAGLGAGTGAEEASADALARLLVPAGDNPTEAAARRREAAAARAGAALPVVPASRRDVVTQYLRLLPREAR